MVPHPHYFLADSLCDVKVLCIMFDYALGLLCVGSFLDVLCRIKKIPFVQPFNNQIGMFLKNSIPSLLQLLRCFHSLLAFASRF